LEYWAAIVDGKLCDDCNHPENLAVMGDVMAVHLQKNPPCLEVSDYVS
jgi:hypothetical protein